MCKNLNEYTTDVDLRELSAACLANILKKFLRELPDPIIPVQWYDRFVEASSKYCFNLIYIDNIRAIYSLKIKSVCLIGRYIQDYFVIYLAIILTFDSYFNKIFNLFGEI